MKTHQPLMTGKRAALLRKWDLQVYGTLRKITAKKTHSILGFPITVFPNVHGGLWTDSQLLGFTILLHAKPDDTVLDFGTGTGIQGIIAAQKAQKVISLDFNEDALKCAAYNMRENNVLDKITLVKSNGFEKIHEKFDLIAINPPFRWFKPKDILDAASNDENYAFLQDFLKTAKNYLTDKGRILLVFANSGDIRFLRKQMKQNRWKTTIASKAKSQNGWTYYVFELRP